MRRIRFSTVVSSSQEKVFDFYEQVASLIEITPPKMGFRVSSEQDRMKKGAVVVLNFRVLGLIPIRWVKKITANSAPERFEDIQQSGPLRSWHHKHFFIPHGDQTEVVDEVDYELPLGLLGTIVDVLIVRRVLTRMFEYRHRKTVEIFGSNA